MPKIKLKFRPSVIAGKAGSIYFSVSHRSVVRSITTGIRVMPEEWDGKNHRLLSAGAGTVMMQNHIDSDMASLHKVVQDLEILGSDYTVDDIVSRFLAPERHMTVLSFFREQIQFLTDCNRLGTAANYRLASNSLSAFLGGRDIFFSEMTSCFVEQYGDYLMRRGMVRNSLSFHMRILRSLYNKAVRRGYAEQSFPFRDVYTGIDRTRKRAVGEDVISRLMRIDVSDSPSLSFARDLFMFSFYTRGMAFVDMAYLRKSDIRDGMLRYARHKTGQHLAVRVEPCIMEIIERYSASEEDCPYVFPILSGEDSASCFSQYKSELRIYNYRLKRLSELLGLGCSLSSYTSRHSWATTARNHNVPLSVISAGMGHSSERTTQIYLTSLENSFIDNANRGILEALNSPAQV